ncbi:uncharacterized protein AMSG_07455 [Thecamonas trahens ATCC 50062]|uniref:Uncharacterized protein n=1 Tax=Thecamonas trahens ATCC 50062 TaxID=461836 RepID=A0A0L0DH67_THETB|nr:hypothetical protein AMSG_07455 [Thecamonas trahens ATCC 50062]KNC51555.1 hypothetical protein AMSG_07455 [Thecamonas trahens ATCC 50062]|eukprot:XP_013755957.1 hypothetical protein AMSG_07455 [Thecamonas trahens ATCC 50062]
MLSFRAAAANRVRVLVIVPSRGMAKGAKKVTKASKKAMAAEATGGDLPKNDVAKLISLVKPQSIPRRSVSKEQAAEEQMVVDAYARHLLVTTRAGKELDRTRLALKHAAIAALPEDLQVAAKIVDTTPFPPSRRIPLDTPPHPSFDDVLAKEQDEV